QALLKRQYGQRHLVLPKWLTPLRADGLNPGSRDRIARRRERQLVDDHAAQRFPYDVHALPETGGCEKHAVRCFTELPEELGPRRRALNEHGILERHFGNRLHSTQRRIACEQHERTSAAALQQFDYLPSRR